MGFPGNDGVTGDGGLGEKWREAEAGWTSDGRRGLVGGCLGRGRKSSGREGKGRGEGGARLSSTPTSRPGGPPLVCLTPRLCDLGAAQESAYAGVSGSVRSHDPLEGWSIHRRPKSGASARTSATRGGRRTR